MLLRGVLEAVDAGGGWMTSRGALEAAATGGSNSLPRESPETSEAERPDDPLWEDRWQAGTLPDEVAPQRSALTEGDAADDKGLCMMLR